MYNIYSFIVSIIIVANGYGQNLSDTAISVLSKEALISKVLSNPIFIKNKIFISRYDADSIDFNVIVYTGLFSDEGNTGRMPVSEPIYRIVAYTLNDSIFLKEISRIKYKQDKVGLKKESSPLFYSADTLLLSKFISNHNLKYRSSWTLRDFSTKSSIDALFGFLCGYVPDMTKSAKYLALLVKANDSIALKNLASSFIAQERAIGTAGLYFLFLKGHTLSKELLALITTNQESNISIFYCEGCLVGEQTMREGLDARNLISIYNLLVRYNLL